ncbi:MAG: outer membrane protein assembly factor BamE [Pseudomonadota bacterium]
MSENRFDRTASLKRLAFAGSLLLVAGMGLSACNGTSQTLSHGYQADQQTLDLVPIGSSREQVLLSLGTPSTQSGEPGSETYYYISQVKKRTAAFMNAKVVDQKVLAVYFASDDTVSQIANYGLKDGKVFDYISRTTPTGGKDTTFIGQILGAATGPVTPNLGRN